MEYNVDTKLTHLYKDPAAKDGFVNPPLYRGSTVLYQSVKHMEEVNADSLKLTAPAYGRFGTPASRLLEDTLNELEGGHGTVLTNSGLSAITTAILSLVKSGDHMLITDSCYWPTRNFSNFLQGLGIEAQYYDPCIGSAISTLIKSNTRLVFMESPGSMTFEVQDVPAIVKVCKERGVSTLIDNTWATPLYFHPLKFGVDISIHAATKYISGHADSFLGAIICSEEHFAKVRGTSIRLGQCAAPEDVNLSLRGLRTLSTRLRTHQAGALKLAAWLIDRKEVKEVLYPALPGSKGHEIWKRDFTGASGLFGMILNQDYKKHQVNAMVDGLKLLGLGHSWGGFESLILPGHPETFRLENSWMDKGPLLRIHVGLEDVRDLVGDLESGFARLNKP